MQAQRICSDAMSACVCVSVTFVDSVKKNKHIFKKIFTSGSQAIQVFFRPNGMAIFRRNPPPPTVASIVVQYIYYTHYKIR